MGNKFSLQETINGKVFPPTRPRFAESFPASTLLTTDRDVPYMMAYVNRSKKNPSNANPVFVVASHGNSETMSTIIGQITKAFGNVRSRVPLVVVAWEYEGYGVRGEVEPSRESIERDAEAIAKQFKDEKVIFFGRSLGGYPAIVAALEHQRLGGVQKLFLLSCFASIMQTHGYLKPFARSSVDDFKNYELAPNYKGETWIVHGDKDGVVAFSNMRALKEAFSHADVQTHVLTGKSHNDTFLDLPKLPLNALVAFGCEEPSFNPEDVSI